MKRTPLLFSLVALFAFGCDKDKDGVSNGDDCSPENPDISPDATETCNGIDDDCDGVVDEGSKTVFYADNDADGFGDPNLTTEACEAPTGFLEDNTDCQPLDPNSFPGAQEVCDDIDNDCDNLVDSDDDSADNTTGQTYYADADQDGYGDPDASEQACGTPTGFVDNAEDCDDANGSVNPETSWYADFDEDGFGSDDYERQACEAPEGYVADGGDCDETNVAINPSADEYCDTIDNNCDGTVDEDSSLDALTWYQDDDGDAYGQTSSTTVACYEPSGYTIESGDCDDAEPAANPGEWEVCDGIDNDCDGDTDYGTSVPTDYATIAEALANATDGDTVCIEAGTYSETELNPNGKSITLVGAGSGSTTIDAGGVARHFYVSSGESLEIRSMTLANGYTNYYGGSIYNDASSVSLVDAVVSDATCTITSTYGYCRGAAIWNGYDAELYVEDVDFTGVVADARSTNGYIAAGVIDDYYSTSMELVNVTVSGADINGYYWTGTYQGGGIFRSLYGTYVSMDGVEIYDNSVVSYGANNGSAIRLYGVESFDAWNVSIHDNEFGSEGSSLYAPVRLDYSDGTVGNLHVADNATTTDSSAYGSNGLYAYGSEIEMSNVILANADLQTTYSYSTNYGTSMYLSSSNVVMTNADVVGNASSGDFYYDYGTIYLSGGASIEVTNTNFVSNSPGAGAAAIYANSGSYSIHYSNLYDNSGDYTLYDGSGEDDLTEWTGLQAVDPLYTDASSDWTLQATSTLIDAGDPNVVDADGSVSDIGAYGGPYGASW